MHLEWRSLRQRRLPRLSEVQCTLKWQCLFLGPHMVQIRPTNICMRNGTILDRSGKIAIWPYIMRELPLSPVEALRLELRLEGSKGRQRPGTATTAVAAEKNSVAYYPACLASDDSANGNNSEREGGLHTRSDLQAPIGFTLNLDSNSRIIRRSDMPSPSAWAPQERAAGSDAAPDRFAPGIMGTKSRRLQCDRRPASASSGARRRPRHLPSRASLLHFATDDYTECPSGCGEEIRLQDLQEHQKSSCASRWARSQHVSYIPRIPRIPHTTNTRHVCVQHTQHIPRTTHTITHILQHVLHTTDSSGSDSWRLGQLYV